MDALQFFTGFLSPDCCRTVKHSHLSQPISLVKKSFLFSKEKRA